jgi:lipopolysaccharide biosynthesis glycosyltransferase
LINFLYVLDENYNLPLLSSITSLLENLKNEVSIYVIHESKDTFVYKELLLERYSNLINFEIFQFDKNISNFETISSKFKKDQHYTEATYYKIFLSDYVPLDIDNIIYIDPDIICINDPSSLIKDCTNNMENKQYIGASTHAVRNESNSDLFDRLEIDSRYFNAGLMFIDLKYWRDQKINIKILDFYEKNFKKIFWADQDLLNAFLNGAYYEIPSSLNFPISSSNHNNLDKNEILKNQYFLHFIGKDKPWDLKGISRLPKFYAIYQDNFKLLNINNLHLNKIKSSSDIVNFFKSKISFKQKVMITLNYLRQI